MTGPVTSQVIQPSIDGSRDELSALDALDEPGRPPLPRLPRASKGLELRLAVAEACAAGGELHDSGPEG